MAIIVCKFGGTSTANAERLRQVRRILDMDPRRRYVVLSAPGKDGMNPKVTDQLYRGDTDAVARRFEAMAAELGLHSVSGRVRRELHTEDQARRVSRGEALCAMVREATQDVLDKVLYEVSCQMKNGYSRSDA